MKRRGEVAWARPSSHIVLVGILATLSVSLAAAGTAAAGPHVAIELETRENTLDGCMDCGCRARGELEAGTKQEWWVTFGLVRSDAQAGWAADDASSRCGQGSFQRVRSDFRQTVGTPYVILHLSTSADDAQDGEVNLQLGLRVHKLSGFDKRGRPTYARSTQNRRLSFAHRGDVTLPLLIPDEREETAFRIDEVLVRLRATVLGHEAAAAYGALSVSADVPGAEIFLDGGFVGRVAEGEAIRLENIAVGTREIRIRDFSGREAQRQVMVKQGKTVEVAFNVLDLPAAEPGKELVPIGKNPQGHEEYWRYKDGAMLLRVPAGEFLMGSPDGQGEPQERPQHVVHVSEFLIDKTEVTWRQFRKYAAATGTPLPRPPLWGTPDDYPVSPILWEAAKEYCGWVGGRLPTEAEWEKAARGTDGRNYPWGDKWEHDRCNSRDGGPHRPLSAGSYPSCLSPYGVLNMAGNVWEWCSDWWDRDYFAVSPHRDPKGPVSGSAHVLKGGSWDSRPSVLSASSRNFGYRGYRELDFGFRCAMNALP